jgi:predicted nucleotidyltransferase
MVRKTSKQVVLEFAKKLKSDFADAKVFLFGSRARNEHLQDSDYDVLVISELFSKKRFFERSEKMYDYWNEKESLEALCYTPHEFFEKSCEIGVVKEAKRTCVRII